MEGLLWSIFKLPADTSPSKYLCHVSDDYVLYVTQRYVAHVAINKANYLYNQLQMLYKAALCNEMKSHLLDAHCFSPGVIFF